MSLLCKIFNLAQERDLEAKVSNLINKLDRQSGSYCFYDRERREKVGIVIDHNMLTVQVAGTADTAYRIFNLISEKLGNVDIKYIEEYPYMPYDFICDRLFVGIWFFNKAIIKETYQEIKNAFHIFYLSPSAHAAIFRN